MSKISRREFLENGGAGLALAAVPGLAALQAPATAPTPAAASAAIGPAEPAPAVAPRSSVAITVNGTEHRVQVEDRWTLAELLRDHLGLTGTKIGCDRGECGACTVLLQGKPVYACSYLAVWADGHSIETVEGLARSGELDPLQQEFIAHDGPQCGYCTPGQLMSARALLARNPHPTADEVRAALTGNICRCSNYNRYVEAVLAASALQAKP